MDPGTIAGLIVGWVGRKLIKSQQEYNRAEERAKLLDDIIAYELGVADAKTITWAEKARLIRKYSGNDVFILFLNGYDKDYLLDKYYPGFGFSSFISKYKAKKLLAIQRAKTLDDIIAKEFGVECAQSMTMTEKSNFVTKYTWAGYDLFNGVPADITQFFLGINPHTTEYWEALDYGFSVPYGSFISEYKKISGNSTT